MKWKTEVINVDSLQVSPGLLDLYASLQVAGGEGEGGQQGSAMSALIHSILSSGYQLSVSTAKPQRLMDQSLVSMSGQLNGLDTDNTAAPPLPWSRTTTQVALHPAWTPEVMVMEAERLYFWNCQDYSTCCTTAPDLIHNTIPALWWRKTELCRNQEMVGGASWHGYHHNH